MLNLWLRGARRILVVVVVLLLVLSAAGALYQALSVRHESVRFPPPGRLVDIGGRRLHLICIGEGRPTVIFESSGLGGALSAEAVRVEVSAQARVCSYDRMGMGWSDPGPAIISAGALADDLERLVDRAELRKPYVLVSASIGGLTAEMFARRHPDQVAGLVFADAADSGVLERFASRVTSTLTEEVCLAKVAARLGLLRLIDPLALRRGASDATGRTIAGIYRVEPMSTLCALVRGIPKSVQELHSAPPLAHDVPLVVLTAETTEGLVPLNLPVDVTTLAPEFRRLQQELSRRSSRGTWRVVPGSDHLIGNSQPHAVASAVLELLTQIRASP